MNEWFGSLIISAALMMLALTVFIVVLTIAIIRDWPVVTG